MLAVISYPRPKSHDQESTIPFECLMEWCDVDLRRSVWLLQADPISTVVSPWLVNNSRLAVELEGDPVVVRPITPNFADTFHGAQ